MIQQKYRSQSKKLMLAGYQIRVRRNEPGSEKTYTRYWADRNGKLLGEVGNEDLERRLLMGTEMGTENI